jgi:hypothetical protein
MYGRADAKRLALLLAACLPVETIAEDVNVAELTCSTFTQKAESISSDSAQSAYTLALSTWLYGFTAAKHGVTTMSGAAAETFLRELKRQCLKRPDQSVLAAAKAVDEQVLKHER